ncbi:MAG: tryptophan--tRNA ligase [Actinobacteria bacterium]|nr:tryptophan--tRNA ligase [Actinomycetota bacterium]
MARVFSGIQPTGDLHLGNYLGAVRQWVVDQDSHEALYCVVDLHAMTASYEPKELTTRTQTTATLLLASGLDPARCTLFVQSQVPAHTELAWILNCTATFGELNRMTQFKDKGQSGSSVTVGLFAYPVLMAADILAYDTDQVPVGDDQRQHLELARDIALRFNNRFGETFTVPKATVPPLGARVMDLQDPTIKMSKSNSSPQGIIGLLDSPETIRKRIRSAVTDSDNHIEFNPDTKPGLANLLTLLAVTTEQSIEAVVSEYESSGYGSLKDATADAIIACLSPIQERYADLSSDLKYVSGQLNQGAERARSLSSPVIARVRERAGLLAP